MEEICRNCRWFVGAHNSALSADTRPVGSCRFNAPIGGGFPIVYDIAFCREFSPIEDHQPPVSEGKFARIPVIESMTKIRSAGHIFRIWRQEEKFGPFYANNELHEAVDDAGNIKEAFNNLIRVERVNAVEITDEAGNGTVYYTDWP